MTDLRLKPGEPLRICGHRGDMRHAPENTLAALRRAHAMGAAACEIDVRLTADHRLVLMHDATVNRTTDGSGSVSEHPLGTIRELDAGSWFGTAFSGERVPLLEEAIALATTLGLVLRVELKDWHQDAILFPALEAALAGLHQPPVVVCSFDLRQLLDLKMRLPGIRTMGIVHGRAVDMVALAISARLDGLSVQTAAMSDPDIQALHEAGLALSCYCPLNVGSQGDQSTLEKLRRWSNERLIDMITVDDVAWLRSVMS